MIGLTSENVKGNGKYLTDDIVDSRLIFQREEISREHKAARAAWQFKKN